MDLNLKGRVALVTGGGRDVGREISTVLGQEGALVAVNYRNSESEAAEVVAEIEKKGGKAKAYKADIANYEDVKKMVADVVKDFGGLDILVNNAGLVITQKFTDFKARRLEAAARRLSIWRDPLLPRRGTSSERKEARPHHQFLRRLLACRRIEPRHGGGGPRGRHRADEVAR
jgi:NAD(P)-dependent dehydrogenase (short-subunit alcohol dehydrogenase family)